MESKKMDINKLYEQIKAKFDLIAEYANDANSDTSALDSITAIDYITAQLYDIRNIQQQIDAHLLDDDL